MQNKIWVDNKRLVIEATSATTEEGQYVLSFECVGDVNVSVCLNPEQWEALLDAAADLDVPNKSFYEELVEGLYEEEDEDPLAF